MPQICLRLREAAGRLPPVCMCCGAPATATEVQQLPRLRRTTWMLLFVTGPLLARAASAIASKSAWIHAPVCDRHRDHWTRGTRLIWRSFALLGGLIATSLTITFLLPEAWRDALLPFVSVICFGLFLIWLGILCIAHDSEIRLIEIDRKELLLDGVCDAFIRAIVVKDLEAVARKKERHGSEPGDGQFESAEKQPSTSQAIED